MHSESVYPSAPTKAGTLPSLFALLSSAGMLLKSTLTTSRSTLLAFATALMAVVRGFSWRRRRQCCPATLHAQSRHCRGLTGTVKSFPNAILNSRFGRAGITGMGFGSGERAREGKLMEGRAFPVDQIYGGKKILWSSFPAMIVARPWAAGQRRGWVRLDVSASEGETLGTHCVHGPHLLQFSAASTSLANTLSTQAPPSHRTMLSSGPVRQ